MEQEKTYTQYLVEKELKDKPLKEAPLTKELLMSYSQCPLKLEKLEGSFIEDYGKVDKEIDLEQSEWARNDLLTSFKPLPGIDPRTGAYGHDFASIGFSCAGEAYLMIGEHDKAIANYSKAIELNPRNIVALYGRGMARYSKGEYQQAALEDLWDAIDLNPIKLAEKNKQTRAVVAMLND